MNKRNETSYQPVDKKKPEMFLEYLLTGFDKSPEEFDLPVVSLAVMCGILNVLRL